jgi:uncharacterized protein YjbJ (UPF0337 family)
VRARMKQLMGQIKQAVGSLGGNRKLEREGRIKRRSGRAGQQFDEATDKATDVIDRSVEATTDAMGPGQSGRRPT